MSKRSTVEPPLGVFRNGQKISDAPEDLYLAYALRDRLAAEHGLDEAEYEVLIQCPEHPDTAQVDCLICDPMP